MRHGVGRGLGAALALALAALDASTFAGAAAAAPEMHTGEQRARALLRPRMPSGLRSTSPGITLPQPRTSSPARRHAAAVARRPTLS